MPHGTKKYQSSKLLNYSFIKHFLSKSLSIRRITHNAHNFASTDAMNEGTALHEIIQNKGQLSSKFAISPFDSFRTKDAKIWKAEQAGENKIVISSEIHNHLTSTYSQFIKFASPSIKEIIENGEPEVELFSTEGDFPLKGIADMLLIKDNCATRLEIKSIADITRANRDATDRCYDIQSSIYNQILRQKYDEVNSITLFIEKRPPYDHIILRETEEYEAVGQKKLELCLENYNDAIARGYDPSVTNPSLYPSYPESELYPDHYWLRSQE